MSSTDIADRNTLGFWAKCRACAHCWIVAFYPDDLRQFVRKAQGSKCPKCGDRFPVVAKQDNGRLMEEQPDGVR